MQKVANKKQQATSKGITATYRTKKGIKRGTGRGGGMGPEGSQ
jgi:hypothetical protein